MWKVPKIWENDQCVIIGGGPSIIKQFDIPEELVKDVYNKKLSPVVYSPYLKQLHDQHVIAVNMAYLLGEWIDILFFGDDSFWNKEKENIFNFKALKVTCADSCTDYRRIKYLKKDPKKFHGISNDPSMVSWNQNSGAAAINLAVHTGVKRIILLGFDMTLDNNQNQHWHKFYKGNKNTIAGTFRNHLKGFPAIAEDAKNLGVEILNANPDSKIQEFKKINFKEIKL